MLGHVLEDLQEMSEYKKNIFQLQELNQEPRDLQVGRLIRLTGGLL